MSFGSGYENMPTPPGEMLASEADREATQDVLKQAFEDERLNQDEFEARIGKAVAARTQGDLAALNGHASLAAGLIDGVKRIAIVDNATH